MPLDNDEIRSVVARADEIQRRTQRGHATSADLEAVIQAAEAVGIERSAVERALRERLHVPLAPPGVGELVFARSTDGKLYVAEVLASGDQDFRVRFLRGSEHTVALDDLRPCSLLPGEKVVVNWPWWGPWTCTVVSYDAAARTVSVTDGWSETHSFPISEIWLNAPRDAGANSRARVYAALLGAGATIGAIVGSIVTALLT